MRSRHCADRPGMTLHPAARNDRVVMAVPIPAPRWWRDTARTSDPELSLPPEVRHVFTSSAGSVLVPMTIGLQPGADGRAQVMLMIKDPGYPFEPVEAAATPAL